MLKRFKINKLFGFRNVNIPFENDIKILIGENGLGKTTVLNCLYYVLSQKYHKLFEIDFERLELAFNDGNKIQFTKRELETYLRFQDRKERRHIPLSIIKQLDPKELEIFLEDSSLNERDLEQFVHRFIIKNKIPRWAPTHVMLRELRQLVHEPTIKKFIQFGEQMKSYALDILYFPTYRRVEEDLKNLGKFRRKITHDFEDDFIEEFEEDFQVSDDTLIHFGMEDVEKRIEFVKDFISVSTVDGFSKVTGEILSQLLKGFPEIDKAQVDGLDVVTAKIVLHRVGASLSDPDRNEILSLLDKPDDLLKKKELTYFLLNLIEIYNQQKHVDDAIKKFRDVCNNYLEDKEFRYNESSVSIDVYRKGTSDVVFLKKLSSGEKQIISLFSKIYLEFSKNYLVLFDEPELSLSIEWQKQLLPDIVKSEKCKFLLSVTHSPFIFKNELDLFAVGMNAYFK